MAESLGFAEDAPLTGGASSGRGVSGEIGTDETGATGVTGEADALPLVALLVGAGSTDADAVIDAIVGIQVPNLTGGVSEMLPNHHITKPVLIGEIKEDGQFETVWQADSLVPGEAWSKYLEGSKDLIADWKTLKCGNYNTATKKCGA